LTDYVAGAAYYARWRNDAVGVLSVLSRLRDGWDITDEQARRIARHAQLKRIFSGKGDTGTSSVDARTDVVFEPTPQAIRSLALDWDRVFDQVFGTHVARLDERFADVRIEAGDDRTFVVQLARPCPFFLDIIALPIFLPCHQSVELLRETCDGAPITAEGLVVYNPQWTKPDYHRNGYPGLITNGPYRLSDWTFKRRARLTVNPYHRAAGAITCRTVDMLVYENISAAIMAYEAGDVEFLPAMDVPYDHEIARLARTGERPDFHLCHVLATYFFNFNCLSKTVGDRPNPFLDRRVRRAFALSVDKRSLVENVLRRGDRVAASFVPPGAIPGYDPPSGLTADIGEARRLFVEAGYPDGTGMPVVELLYTPGDERICQAVARMWEEALGVSVELRSRESKTFAEDKANHRFMIARGNWYADYNDPTTFLDCLSTGNGNNDSGYANPQYDDLLARANQRRDPAKRAALLRRAEAILVEEDLPILPILHYVTPIAIKPHVRGLYPNARLWFPFRYVTLER
jgi:oligopeptide transport system substrate-binding protein